MTLDEIIKTVDGLESKAELELLQKAVLDIKPKVAVEIGTLFGLSASTIINVMDGGDLFCVENFAVQGSDTRPYFIEKVLPQYPNMHLLEMDSRKAATEFHQTIDFLFIDGDHQDDGIQRDLKDWLPKVRLGGIVAFHDYFNDLFPPVRTRVEEFTSHWLYYGQADSLMLKIKPTI